jgi:hypothetical protein
VGVVEKRQVKLKMSNTLKMLIFSIRSRKKYTSKKLVIGVWACKEVKVLLEESFERVLSAKKNAEVKVDNAAACLCFPNFLSFLQHESALADFHTFLDWKSGRSFKSSGLIRLLGCVLKCDPTPAHFLKIRRSLPTALVDVYLARGVHITDDPNMRRET